MKPPFCSALFPLLFLFPVARALDVSTSTDWAGPWTTGGIPYSNPSTNDGSWTEQTLVSLDGIDAALGQLSQNSVETWMETTITGPATLYYSYRVSDFTGSYPDGSFAIKVNAASTQLASHTGSVSRDTGWKEGSASLPGGSNIVRWTLKNFRGASPVKAYLDQVWTSDDPRPRITSVTVPAATIGSPFAWTVPVTSSTTATVSATGLPAGLGIDGTTFVISGTPTAAGIFETTLTAVNASGQHVAKVLIDVAPGSIDLSEALDASHSFSQPTVAEAGIWTGASGLGHDGVDCARVACAVPQFSTFPPSSIVQTIVNGPGTLNFWFKNEAPGGTADTTSINLHVGVNPPQTFTGLPAATAGYSNTEWAQASVAIPAGPQLISWSAARIVAISYPGMPTYAYAYLDQIVFTPSSVGPQSTFAAWQSAWNVAGQSAISDSDGDGLTLLMEYATGGSPYAPNSANLPTVSMVDGHLTLYMPKAASPTDLLYIAQSSKNLAPNSWTTVNVETLEEDETHILARCKKAYVEEPVCSLRVKVIVSP